MREEVLGPRLLKKCLLRRVRNTKKTLNNLTIEFWVKESTTKYQWIAFSTKEPAQLQCCKNEAFSSKRAYQTSNAAKIVQRGSLVVSN